MSEPSAAEQIAAYLEAGEALERLACIGWERLETHNKIAAAMRDREPRERRAIAYLLSQVSTPVCADHDSEPDCSGCEVKERVAAILRGEP